MDNEPRNSQTNPDTNSTPGTPAHAPLPVHLGSMSPPRITATLSQSSNASSSIVPAIPFNRILSPVEYHNLRFLILDCPTDTTLPLYLQEMKARRVSDVVRVCEPTYNKTLLEDNGIKVHDYPFKDGGIPSNEIILNFLSLCDERFQGITQTTNASGPAVTKKDSTPSGNSSTPSSNNTDPCIAVHCVAGLGRAPVLVAICLIESGMAPIDSVEYVRQRRRGALNTVQLAFLMDTYKRQWQKKSGVGSRFSKNVGLKRAGSPATNTGKEDKSITGNGGPSTAHPNDSVPPSTEKPSGSSGALSGLKESLTKVFRFTRKD